MTMGMFYLTGLKETAEGVLNLLGDARPQSEMAGDAPPQGRHTPRDSRTELQGIHDCSQPVHWRLQAQGPCAAQRLARAPGWADSALGCCDIFCDGNEYSSHQSPWKETDPEKENKGRKASDLRKKFFLL